MKKKLYDFSIASAVIVVLAYTLMFFFSVYSIVVERHVSIGGIVALFLLGSSFGLVIWFYVILAPTVTDKGIKRGRLFIPKKMIVWTIEYNHRFRYDEIIFRNRTFNYEVLTKTEKMAKTIFIQFFPKYELFIREYFSTQDRQGDCLHEKKER